MEIDTNLPNPNPSANNQIEFSSSSEMQDFVECLIGTTIKSQNNLNNLQDIISLINEIKFKEKKKSDFSKILCQNLEACQTTQLNALKEQRGAKFFKTVKLENRTRYYNTAEKDDISPTMFAYYFCDKSKQHLSDKEAAAMKAIHMDSNYDLQLEAKKKEEDEELSTISNPFNSNDFRLKKKRKSSFNTNTGKSNKKRKGNDKTKDSDEEMKSEEKDYCIPSCTIGRNNPSPLMVCCDKCEVWYHAKCVNIPEENLSKINEMEWFCPECKKKGEDKSKEESSNNKNSNLNK